MHGKNRGREQADSSVNSHRDEVEVTIAIFTEPEVTNCFSIIALVIIRENKTKIANFLKLFYFSFKKKHAPKHALRARHCYNHLAVIIPISARHFR